MIKRFLFGIIFLVLITCVPPDDSLFISPPLLPYTYSTMENQFLDSINAYRIELGIGELEEYSSLSVLASKHNKNMISIDSIGHFGFPSRLIYVRDTLGFTGVGENVGYGYATSDGFIRAFKKSQGHNAVLINPKYKVHGVSISSNSSGRNYLTHILIY